MFRCQRSGEVSQPGEKPVRVVLSERPARYTNIGEEGPKITFGHEIEREAVCRLIHVDPEHAKRIAEARKPISFKYWQSAYDTRMGHAQKCKRTLEECAHCQDNVKWFTTLPLNVLSHVTEENRFK